MVALKKVFLAAVCAASAAAVDINVSGSGGNATGYGQTRYGFLHEDINNSGDGGIYAELVRNRAFQHSRKYPVSTDGYRPVGGAKLSIQMLDEPLSDALTASMRVKTGGTKGQVGFQNEGYWGMDVKQQPYSGSFWVKGEYTGCFFASLRSNSTGEIFGSTKIQSQSTPDEWVEHRYELVPKKDAPSSNNTLAITFSATVSAVVTSEIPVRRLTTCRALHLDTSTST